MRARQGNDDYTTRTGDDTATYGGTLEFAGYSFCTLAPIGTATTTDVAQLDQAASLGTLPDAAVVVETVGGVWVPADTIDPDEFQAAVAAHRRIAVRVQQ
jgi:hypothetical protein